MRSLLVTVPFMPAAQARLRDMAPEGVTVEFVRVSICHRGRDAVVALAGYNTVCEVLGAGTPAVLVPRNGLRQEQKIRASRFASLGIFEQLPLDALAPASLADALRRALARGRIEPPGQPLDGLARLVLEIERLLPKAADSEAPRLDERAAASFSSITTARAYSAA
jgi:predicted glycosyltransferase